MVRKSYHAALSSSRIWEHAIARHVDDSAPLSFVIQTSLLLAPPEIMHTIGAQHPSHQAIYRSSYRVLG